MKNKTKNYNQSSGLRINLTKCSPKQNCLQLPPKHRSEGARGNSVGKLFRNHGVVTVKAISCLPTKHISLIDETVGGGGIVQECMGKDGPTDALSLSHVGL